MPLIQQGTQGLRDMIEGRERGNPLSVIAGAETYDLRSRNVWLGL